MKTLEQQMAFYAAYHRDTRNVISHFIGVPLIVFGVMLALSWLRISLGFVEITAAMVLTLLILLYYLVLDIALGAAMIVLLGALLVGADLVSRQSFGINLAVFLVTFAGGWVIQLVGHVYEGRKPALVDNLFQIFVAPIFLAAEAMFAMGMRRALRQKVEALSHEFDARSAPKSGAQGAAANTPLAAD